MKTTKDVKVLFYQLYVKQWKKGKRDSSQLEPYLEVEETLTKISRLARLKRFYDLNDGKFFFLESFKSIEDDENIILKGYFKSARNEFRPNLVNKKTGQERRNPKLLVEGDIEKTHFIFKIAKERNEVYLLLEFNYHGITCTNIIEYLTHYQRIFHKNDATKKYFEILKSMIPGNDFIHGLQLSNRIKMAEVFFDKQLLGGNALNFSNRTISLKQDLKLIATADIGENIKELAADLFNAFNADGSKISRVRVFGNDADNNDIKLDTQSIIKNEWVKVDLNPETGEVVTPQILTGLFNMSENL